MTYVGIDLHSNNMVNVAINGNAAVGRFFRHFRRPREGGGYRLQDEDV
jgi:hypothetical protein